LTVSLGGIWFLTTANVKTTSKTAPQTAEVTTRPGTRTKLVLPDGSTIWLNAGSKLAYSQPFDVKDRRVTLTGEAFFDVAKTGELFIIHTEGVQIKVLGTAFNVRSYPAEKKIETSLVRGRVEVSMDDNPEKKYVLTPNEKLTLNTAGTTSMKKKQLVPLAIVSTLRYSTDSTTIAETSWVENKLVFIDESFEDIAKKLEQWYGVTIVFKNSTVKGEHFTGVFEKETIGQALEALQLTTPFRFIVRENSIIITQ
jgi:ferric-dicitrate binding protein FerR (iron transport regulator)